MGVVEAEPPRFTVEGGVIRMPVPRNWILLVLLIAVCAAFLLFTVQGARQSGWLFAVPPALGALWLLANILWMAFGEESIAVDSGVLQHRFGLFAFHRTQSYELSQIRRLRAVEYTEDPRHAFPQLFQGGHGPIAFDYGARTIRLGGMLSTAEGQAVVEILAKRMI